MTNVEICLVDLKMSFISYNYQKVEAWKTDFTPKEYNAKQARDGRFAECTRSDFERADLLDFDIQLPKFNFE